MTLLFYFWINIMHWTVTSLSVQFMFLANSYFRAGVSTISVLEVLQSPVEGVRKAVYRLSRLLESCGILWCIDICQAEISANSSCLVGILGILNWLFVIAHLTDYIVKTRLYMGVKILYLHLCNPNYNVMHVEQCTYNIEQLPV